MDQNIQFAAAVIKTLLEGDGIGVNGHAEHLPRPWTPLAVSLKRCHNNRQMMLRVYDSHSSALGPELCAEIRAAVDAVQLPVDLDALAAAMPRDPGPMVTWQFKSLKDAYQPRPPIHWIVRPIFSAPGLYIVYGAPGTLKSGLLADLAVCVADGAPWLEPEPNRPGVPYTVSQGEVYWLDFDNGRRRSDERFSAYGRGHTVAEDAPLHYVSMPNPWLNAGSRDDILNVANLLYSAALIVIDNLGNIISGKDENSSDMAEVMSNLRLLAEETKAAVLIIHHSRKTLAGGAGGGRKGDSLRGSSSIEAAIDGAFVVEREPKSASITLTATKERGATIPMIGAKFVYDQDESGELYSARFWGERVIDPDDPNFIYATLLDELSTFPNGTAGKIELRDKVHKSINEIGPVGKNRISALIDSFVTDGKLISKKIGPKNVITSRSEYDD